MGDPAGVGPEVVIKALADPAVRKLARFVVFGMNELLAYAADLAEVETYWHRLQHDSPRADYDLIHDVVVLGLRRVLDALDPRVGPDEGRRAGEPPLPRRRHRRGPPSPRPERHRRHRHRPHLQGLVEARRLPLPRAHRAPRLPHPLPPRGHDVPRPDRRGVAQTSRSPPSTSRSWTCGHVLTIGSVFDPIDLGHQAMRRMGVDRPRIAVCGLNPHASEGGPLRRRGGPPHHPRHRDGAAGRHGRGRAPSPPTRSSPPTAAASSTSSSRCTTTRGSSPSRCSPSTAPVNVTLGTPSDPHQRRPRHRVRHRPQKTAPTPAR